MSALSYKIKNRLYLNIDINSTTSLTLENEEFHYLKNVLRSKLGDHIGIFNGKDGEYSFQVDQLAKRSIILKKIEKIKEHFPPENICLLFTPLKKTPLEYLIQKATEIGCGIFQPIITDHTVIRDISLERCRKIIIEAAEQCGLTSLPEIHSPISFDKALDQYSNIIFCNERGGDPIISSDKAFPKFCHTLLIGPEGGFSKKEHIILQKHPNTYPVTLGKRIMRAETAAIVGLSHLIIK